MAGSRAEYCRSPSACSSLNEARVELVALAVAEVTHTRGPNAESSDTTPDTTLYRPPPGMK